MTTRNTIAFIIASFTISLTVCAQQKDSVTITTTVPVRIGVVPGISTQGKADVKTTSTFSLNIYGGITGSVNGIELGSLFNIDKQNTRYVQLAGLFNITGGNAEGLQAAGLINTTGHNLNGLQAAGILNTVGGNVKGMQASGIHNQAGGQLTGLQTAGISNFAGRGKGGMQVSGIANIMRKGSATIQISGIVNYAHTVNGVQIGLINIADTLNGLAIGLINISKNGYHKLSFSSNEVLNANIALRTGNARLYSILLAGVNAGDNNKVFSYGYGLGHEVPLIRWLSVNPEITSQYLYLGNWHYLNLLNKLTLQVNVKVGKSIAFFGGPSFAAYYTDQPAAVTGYKYRLPSNNYHVFELWNDDWTGWIGWNAGISFF